MPARKRRQRPALVRAYLEDVSARMLEKYQDVIRDLIAREHGIYALYKGKRLYYVGLAVNLRGRLRQHLKDRHSGKWDKFSLYLVRHVDHIREIEALVLRITDPDGNKVGGKLRRAKSLTPAIRQELTRRTREEIDDLVPRRRRRVSSRGRPTVRKRKARGEGYVLADIVPGKMLYAEYKGKDHKAHVRRNGQIQLKGWLYDTPTAAARQITKRPVNGWHFWWVRDRGERVRLRDYRRRR